MEKTPYLNKALESAKEEFSRADSLRRNFDKSIGEIKKAISDTGADPSIITELQKAAKAKDLNRIIELKNKLK